MYFKYGFRYVQDWSGQHFVQDVCRQFLPCTSFSSDPTRSQASHHLTRTLTYWGGSRSAGADTRLHRFVWVAFFQQQKIRAAERPALTDKTQILHEGLRRPVLHVG